MIFEGATGRSAQPVKVRLRKPNTQAVVTRVIDGLSQLGELRGDQLGDSRWYGIHARGDGLVAFSQVGGSLCLPGGGGGLDGRRLPGQLGLELDKLLTSFGDFTAHDGLCWLP